MVFSTKNREPLLHREIRKTVFRHIKKNAEEKGIWLDCVNGYSDHAHCLVSLGRDQTISKVAQLIKGESSFWINKNSLSEGRFTWQDDYWALSVSESHLEEVRLYIHLQEKHHAQTTFAEEVNEVMKKYGWEVLKS